MGFYEVLSQYYDVLFPAGTAQVDFVSGRVPAGGVILDVAAGTGNLAWELSRKGYRVTAIDVDPGMVEGMRRKLSDSDTVEEGDGAFEPKLMDMRGLQELQAGVYDSVLCVGNSLVHLNDLTEIADALIRMMDRLKPGGVLMLQIVNYDRILRNHIKELPWMEKEAGSRRISFGRAYELEEDGILFHGRIRVEEPGQDDEEYQNTVRLLPLQSEELLQIVEQYGLPEPILYGSFTGEPYGPDSPALLAVMVKP